MLTKVVAGGFLALYGLAGAALAEDNHIDTIRSNAPELARYGELPIGVRTLKLVHRDQLDIVHATAGQPIPRYDRPLTVEVWYPAQADDAHRGDSAPVARSEPDGERNRHGDGGRSAGKYRVMTRDGQTVTLYGQAQRNAAADTAGGPYPLVIISHGYPGNRYLLSHLGENLASKGYVVVSIDHTDSTYADQAAFGSTLMNRSLDQLFVLNEMARLNLGGRPAASADNAAEADSLRGGRSTPFKGMIDADNTALVGYSMGGYGVLNTLGAGLTAATVASPQWAPNSVLAARQLGNPAYLKSQDKRIKAAVAFAPWGWNAGMWDAASLAELKTPLFFVAGSADDVSGYSPGVRNLYEGSVNAPRYLLTFENANHNAGAPMPAPIETWAPSPTFKGIAAEHYADAVWDTVRMNNISQHFVTAFLGKYLKSQAAMEPYLTLVPRAADGKWSVDASGAFKPDHTYWKGFANRTAVGLRLEQLQP